MICYQSLLLSTIVLNYVCVTCTILIMFIYYYTVAPYDVMITADFYGDVEARPAVVEYGDVLIMNCITSGDPNNMFFWYKDNVLLEGNYENILELTAVSAADGGLYECVVNNTAGNSTVNITIYGRSQHIIMKLLSMVQLKGNVTLACSFLSSKRHCSTKFYVYIDALERHSQL